MGWWNDGDELNFMGFFGSGDYNSSSSTFELSPPTTEQDIKEYRAKLDAERKRQEREARKVATDIKTPSKSSVKIGSLPRIPAWLLHVGLAIAAAGIVHLVIYFYGR